MKRSFSFLTAAITVSTVAYAEDFRAVCTRDGDERLIEVVSPGEVGRQCDVRYVRDGGANARTPYHANNSAAFCLEKANELMGELQAAGFVCVAPGAGAAPTLRTSDEPAPEPDPEPAPEPAPDSAAEPESDFVIETQRGESPAAAPADIAPQAPEDDEPDTAALDAVEDDINLAAQMDAILEQAVFPTDNPSSDQSRAPADLMAGIEETALAEPPYSGQLAPISGADPDAAPTAITRASQTRASQTQAEIETPPAEYAAAVPIEAASVAEAPTSATRRAATPTLLRKPEDIVRATLRAQAAAWNEGDLEAFMDIYWKDDDLKFVSGGDVTQGWSGTMKRYRDRYQGAPGMGQIELDNLDAHLVTDGVAIITGRVRHFVGENMSASVFSLVMRRDDGVWRIVHDHTAADTRAQ